jgi:glycosyltransferase involved in cell wall biosynthesis
MIKVAFIIPRLGRGGAERVVFNLVQEFKCRKIHVLCICLESLGALGEDLLNMNFDIQCLNSRSGYDVNALWHLRRILRQFKPDIVNVHSYTVLPYIILSCFFFCSFKIVFTAHGLLFADYFKKKRWQFYLVSKFLTGVTAVAPSVAEKHRKYIRWTHNIEVIANGIDFICPDVIAGSNLRIELGIPKDVLIFLVVGNVRPEKGIEDLLEATKLLADRNINDEFRVVVAGSMDNHAEYANFVRNKCKDIGVSEMVHFIGHRKDMAAVYAAGDAFVLSSRSEGLPMVVLEALSAGLPVVATKVGGVESLLRGVAGTVLVDSQDPEQLSAAMDKVLRGALDDGGGDMENFRKLYSIEAMADNYLNYFYAVI